jgi:hypothetical protein
MHPHGFSEEWSKDKGCQDDLNGHFNQQQKNHWSIAASKTSHVRTVQGTKSNMPFYQSPAFQSG